MYTKIGATNDELVREKERKKKTNETLAAFKNIKKNTASPYDNAVRNKDIALALLNLSGRTLSLNSSMESLGNNKATQKKNIIALKYMIKNMKLTRFDINSTLNSRKFCNVSGDAAIQNDNNLKRKIRN
jgi:hypothetical protein